MAGKKNMKNFQATFLNMKDQNVTKKEFLARNHMSAMRKANRQIKKYIRVLSVDEIANSKMSA
jgi:hypothetical protein